MPAVQRLLMRSGQVLSKVPFLVAFILDREIGAAYGIGPVGRIRLIVDFYRNIQRVETLSSVVEHLELAAALLRIGPGVEGVVVECGCYKGGSSVNLSIVCALVGRRLVICDSFEGLPKPQEYDESHPVPHRHDTEDYHEGQFAAPRELVEDNLRKFGRLDVCDFKVGFFDKSLKDWDQPVAMGFLDVDLIDSLRPCLTAFWPRLDGEGRLYVHEAGDLDLVATFFEADWWQRELGTSAPGFIGAGTGLPLMPLVGSELGYARKAAAGS
jgi:O-methyltransferase